MSLMPKGKLSTFHSNMLSLIDSRNSPNNFGNAHDVFLERYFFHQDVKLTIFGNVHSRNRNYCMINVTDAKVRVSLDSGLITRE